MECVVALVWSTRMLSNSGGDWGCSGWAVRPPGTGSKETVVFSTIDDVDEGIHGFFPDAHHHSCEGQIQVRTGIILVIRLRECGIEKD